MEQTWTLSGAFAEWKITLVAEPPEEKESFDVSHWPTAKFDRAARLFMDMIDLYECDQILNQH
ncbi:hypothetical protein F0L68_37740 [Solihabitans fulvus]|uniref:Uncharacterized protein n=1 Tax=Solihabitans fulvus TaxID=1892852 RepID=A0A5B2WG81_9PSEU|nr:hypothetical protein [Solihabitans fulvus]KAA2251173.1 hypothetical protein F0L68_37740 [Solihabitans fulvus]